jgi:DNA-directed RNA polymerase specialized sigma24 family protein
LLRGGQEEGGDGRQILYPLEPAKPDGLVVVIGVIIREMASSHSGEGSAEAGKPSVVRRFPSTMWSDVEEAADIGTTAGQRALNRVLQRYRKIVLRYLSGRFAVSESEAEDLWHGFVMSRILQGDWMNRVNRDRGKFRNLLIKSLDRHVISELRRRNAQKRTPEGEVVSLEVVGELDVAEVASDDDADQFWASAVIAGALLNMQLECSRNGWGKLWRVFEGRVLSVNLEGKEPVDYEALRQECAFESAAQACNALTSAKRMFRRHVTRVVAEYSVGDFEAAEEIEELCIRLER